MRMVMEINHRPETVLNHHDFEDLIDKYMGSEAANYYRDSMYSVVQRKIRKTVQVEESK